MVNKEDPIERRMNEFYYHGSVSPTKKINKSYQGKSVFQIRSKRHKSIDARSKPSDDSNPYQLTHVYKVRNTLLRVPMNIPYFQ